MRQHVAVEGIECGIVDVGLEHALAQIIQDHHPSHTAQPSKSLLMQLRPDLRTGTERQQAHRFATEAQRQHEQPRTAIFSGMGVAHQWARSVIDLGFFSGLGFDHAQASGDDLRGVAG